MDKTQLRIVVGVLTGVIITFLLMSFPAGLGHQYFESLLSTNVLVLSLLIVVGLGALMAWVWPKVTTAHIILVTATFIAFGIFLDLAVFIALAFTSLVLWLMLSLTDRRSKSGYRDFRGK